MKYRNWMVIILLLFGLTGMGQVVQPGKVKLLKKSDHGVIIQSEKSNLSIDVFTPQVIRVRLSRTALPENFSYAVIREPVAGFLEIKEEPMEWILKTDSLKVIVTKDPLRLRFVNLKEQVLSEDYPSLSYTWQGTEVTCYRTLYKDEKFIGLGAKTGNLNRRGEKFENWNSDIPAYALNEDPLYVSIPFFMGIHDRLTYGIFMDNSYRTQFNFGASTDEQFSSFSAADGEMNYFFFGASSVAGIISDYTWLTGRMEMPPLWSLGYQQCRWSYYPESEVIGLAEKFRDNKIPCDVIYLDIDYMDSYKIFTWNKDRFPDPTSMISKLNGMGFHLVTIVDPGIKVEKGYFAYEDGVKNDYFIKYPDGRNYIGNVWPGRCHFPDFTKPVVRTWWGSSFNRLTDTGVEGFWNDMNEPSAWGQSIPNILSFDFDGNGSTMAEAHNVYGLNMSRATMEGTKKLLNGKRPFILTRAGYAGIQRYSAVWTGDNEATDEHMLLGARMVNSMGLSGISFAGPDMGGFMGNPSKELYQRWLTLGVYTPFFRNHSAWDTKAKEPWSFGTDVLNFSINVISMRYKLLPYLYSEFHASVQTGMPVARSLAIDYTFDEKVYWRNYQNQYLFGSNILVAPVSCEQNFAKVYLPEGDWYRLTSGELFKGNNEVIVDAPLNNLPVFIKASGILPLQSPVQYTAQKPSSLLELHIYRGTEDNQFVYYEDDGLTYEFEKGSFYKRTITYEPGKQAITLGKADGSFTSKFTAVKIVFHGFKTLMSVNVSGSPVTLKLKSDKERSLEIPWNSDPVIIKY
ncbi:MAG: TIM-barrel domain-containing protein [bacterium]